MIFSRQCSRAGDFHFFFFLQSSSSLDYHCYFFFSLDISKFLFVDYHRCIVRGDHCIRIRARAIHNRSYFVEMFVEPLPPRAGRRALRSSPFALSAYLESLFTKGHDSIYPAGLRFVIVNAYKYKQTTYNGLRLLPLLLYIIPSKAAMCIMPDNTIQTLIEMTLPD